MKRRNRAEIAWAALTGADSKPFPSEVRDSLVREGFKEELLLDVERILAWWDHERILHERPADPNSPYDLVAYVAMHRSEFRRVYRRLARMAGDLSNTLAAAPAPALVFLEHWSGVSASGLREDVDRLVEAAEQAEALWRPAHRGPERDHRRVDLGEKLARAFALHGEPLQTRREGRFEGMLRVVLDVLGVRVPEDLRPLVRASVRQFKEMEAVARRVGAPLPLFSPRERDSGAGHGNSPPGRRKGRSRPKRRPS